MSNLAPLLQRFFTDRLMRERKASPHTIASYRTTFQLLLRFIQQTTGRAPSQLALADLNAAVIAEFLASLETARGNSATTRNTRLAAIHSFFRYVAVFVPDQAGVVQQVLALPNKRAERPTVSYLTPGEAAALIAAPDRTTWLGRRDHAVLVVALHTGLRVSELTALTIDDVRLGTGPHIACRGKGRKDRTTPLNGATARTVRVWLAERGGAGHDPVFPTRSGTRLSRDAVAYLVTKHATAAAEACPSIGAKSISPHTLRHSTAMGLLHAGVDTSVIALWLGHESPETTQMYMHADMSIKERALARMTSAPNGKLRRYRAPDSLLAFLESL